MSEKDPKGESRTSRVEEFILPISAVASLTTITALSIAVVAFLYSLEVCRSLLIWSVIIPMIIASVTSSLSSIFTVFYAIYTGHQILRIVAAISFFICLFALLVGIFGVTITLHSYYSN